MLAGPPKISCEDVKIRMNGVYSGSADVYWFWGQSISSGSLWDIVSGSDIYLRDLIGEGIWNSSDADTINKVKQAELLYTCFNTTVNLSGGVITEGFAWATGPIRVDTRAGMVPGWNNLINQFRLASQNSVRNLQTFVISEDWNVPNWKQTSPSVY